MFSMITNICNKKTKGPTLMELFSHRKTEKVFFFHTHTHTHTRAHTQKKTLQLEIFNVCTMGDMAHINTIFRFLPHMHQHLISACTDTQFQ